MSAFSEWPLLVFTALGALGAGSFMLIGLLEARGLMSEGKSSDASFDMRVLTLVPAVVVLLGFIAAFFHLTAPLHAFGVFNGLLRSPMSNELLVAVVFALCMAVLTIGVLAQKISGSALRTWSVIVGVLGICFSLAMGMAYGISTIPTWGSVWPVVQMLGLACAGGSALVACLLAYTKSLSALLQAHPGAKTILRGMSVLGLVLAVCGMVGMAIVGLQTENYFVSGIELVNNTWVLMGISVVLLAAASVCMYVLTRKPSVSSVALLGLICAVAGVILARGVFYALQISVGIFLM